MRWLVIALALVASALLVQQQRLASKLDALAGEVRLAREQSQGPGASSAVVLEPRERELLVELIAGRVAAALAVRAAPALAGVASAKAVSHEPPSLDALPARTVEAPAPTPAQREAAEQAGHLVEGAIASGALRAADVNELRQLSTHADPRAFQELRRQIAVAINLDRLRLDDPTAGLP